MTAEEGQYEVWTRRNQGDEAYLHYSTPREYAALEQANDLFNVYVFAWVEVKDPAGKVIYQMP